MSMKQVHANRFLLIERLVFLLSLEMIPNRESHMFCMDLRSLSRP